MTTNTYGGYTPDHLREFIRHHYDAEHGGDNIDELTNDSSASAKIVRDLLDAIEPQKDGDLLRPIARWVYNAVRVNLDLLHGICAEFGCPQGEDVATWLRARLAGVPVPCTCTGLGPCEKRTDGSCRRERAVAPARADERATFPRYTEWLHLRTHGEWSNGVPKWARDHTGRMNDFTAATAVIEELAALASRASAHAAEPVAYVCSASNDFAPIVRDKDAAQRLSDAHGDGKVVPLYAAPQPPRRQTLGRG
ncbi:hypothetical protein [Burkholderia sp. 9779_493]|uniref:hypothetical protein n=1 Tax=Burkholderia sp. 9779_493 TaxID=2751184 RepID=UPI0018C4457F|nr:hypothetical protein [Burkholderia sp. 9779_493]MBG0865459.1 hypothetical protein [Burkholderia sp. 9779_493]